MIKTDWWRIQEEQGIELMLRMNGMTRDDVEIVEFPYADGWYNDPKPCWIPWKTRRNCGSSVTTSTILAFRPLETALLNGTVDAIYTQSKPFQHLQEATGKMKAIEDLSRYPDWTLQVANIPAVYHLHRWRWPRSTPSLVVTFMKGMIKVGRWANEHQHAAAAILNKQTFYLDVEDTYRGIQDIDMVPNLSPQNMASVEIGKDFMLSHGYIKNDFRCDTSGLHQSSSNRRPENCWKRNGRRQPLPNFPKLLLHCNPENGSGSREESQQKTCLTSQGTSRRVPRIASRRY